MSRLVSTAFHEVHDVLWRVIGALSERGVFLERTNHLSDRELYAVLWHDVMRQEHAALPDGVPGGWHVDIPGDDEHAMNYLTFYASDEERERWRREFPDAAMPAHQDPAHDRDRSLPEPAD